MCLGMVLLHMEAISMEVNDRRTAVYWHNLYCTMTRRIMGRMLSLKALLFDENEYKSIIAILIFINSFRLSRQVQCYAIHYFILFLNDVNALVLQHLL